MKEFKAVEKRVLELEDIRCDRCNRSCVKEIDADFKSSETAAFTADWGYGSDYDGQKWNSELCQDCADKIKKWINSGPGSGVLVANAFGDISKEEAENILRYSCSEWTGMSMDEFLSARLTEELPDNPGFRQAEWYARIIESKDPEEVER